MRIMFTGPSGLGKSTLAKWVAERFNIPFISGSYYDLVGGNNHQEILSEDPKDTYNKDWQLLNLRNKAFRDKTDFVTDRSFIDNAAYFWYKQDTHIPECEIEHFMETCFSLMTEHCDILFILTLNLDNRYRWIMEDNQKRITNRYFQIHIGELMNAVANYHNDIFEDRFWETNFISSLDLNTRKEEIGWIIKNWMKNHEG